MNMTIEELAGTHDHYNGIMQHISEIIQWAQRKIYHFDAENKTIIQRGSFKTIKCRGGFQLKKNAGEGAPIQKVKIIDGQIFYAITKKGKHLCLSSTKVLTFHMGLYSSKAQPDVHYWVIMHRFEDPQHRCDYIFLPCSNTKHQFFSIKLGSLFMFTHIIEMKK